MQVIALNSRKSGPTFRNLQCYARKRLQAAHPKIKSNQLVIWSLRHLSISWQMMSSSNSMVSLEIFGTRRRCWVNSVWRRSQARKGVAQDKIHSFLIRNIVFPAEAEYFYFSADFRLNIFLWIFLDFSICIWIWCLEGVKVILEQACIVACTESAVFLLFGGIA